MNKRLAFTLIELLVVIAVIGILSGLIVVSMSGTTDKAKIAKSQIFSNSLRNSLLLNLVSEWKFDELTTAVHGGTTIDSWNGNNPLTINTNSDGLDKIKSNSDCIYGKCLSLDGTDDYLYASGSDSITNNLAITGAITLSTWVKFNELNTDRTIMARGIYNTGGDYGYILWRYGINNRIYFSTNSTTTRDNMYTTSGINDTNWHYIVATWDGTTNSNGKKIYVDGLIAGQGTSTISTMGQPAYQFRIGQASNGNYKLNGLIDETKIFNASVPISQIRENYFIGLNSLLSKGGITKQEYEERLSFKK
jgi:prepilin-type N-terminal cleavage/methylation domain-containing protein